MTPMVRSTAAMAALMLTLGAAAPVLAFAHPAPQEASSRPMAPPPPANAAGPMADNAMRGGPLAQLNPPLTEQQRAQIRQIMQDEHEVLRQKIAKVLTPEQMQQLETQRGPGMHPMPASPPKP